ncbi:MAG: YceI family protein [Bacteriovoracaceae bacterium]
MKHFILLLFLSFSLNAAEFNIDTKNSVLKWTGKKVSGEHNGTISLRSGKIKMLGDDLNGGEFIIDMQTIKCDDITNEKYNKKLVNHLKSADFFNVEKFNTAKLVIKNSSLGKGGHYDVLADLTINGVTKPIGFKAQILKNKEATVLTSNIEIDRTLWGIKYKSKSVFKDLADNFIYDKFRLDVKVMAKK